MALGLDISIGLDSGGGVFAPYDAPGSGITLIADIGVASSGGLVDSWTDPHTGIAASNTGSNRPTLTASVLGGRAGITFGTGHWLENAVTNLVSAGAARTIFVVAKDSTEVGGAIFTVRRAADYQSTTALKTGVNVFMNGDGTHAAQNVTIADFTKANGFYAAYVFTGAGANPSIYLNGATSPSTITSAGTSQGTENGTTGFQIGRNAVGPQYWPENICTIVVRDLALPAASLAQLAAWARSYYSLP